MLTMAFLLLQIHMINHYVRAVQLQLLNFVIDFSVNDQQLCLTVDALALNLIRGVGFNPRDVG